MQADPVASVLGDRDKRDAAAQLLGQAFVTAYAFIQHNREQGRVRVADVLIERREMHGDDVTELLDSVGLRAPELDLADEEQWPRL